MLPLDVIRALPKTDLHVHLDGSLREATLIELARERGVKLPSETVEGLNELVFRPHYASLAEYLHGFALTGAVMKDAEALERIAYELAWDNIDEGVRYIEVRFAPHLHVHPGLGFQEVLQAVDRGLSRAVAHYNSRSEGIRNGREPRFAYGIIACAMRKFEPVYSDFYRRFFELHSYSPPKQVFQLAAVELARAVVDIRDRCGVPVVGFDLAGDEFGYPAVDFKEAYDYVHRNFMKKTVHAGEAYGPESIFQAITDLHADRIGHGYHLFSPGLCGPGVADPDEYVRRLARYIADRRITIEVCITSNLQTNPTIKTVKNHVLGRMLAENLSATLCTDNRLVSHTTVSRELQLAIEAFEMDLKQLRNTIVYGFKRSFFPGPYNERRRFVRQIIDHYDRVIDRWKASQAQTVPG